MDTHKRLFIMRHGQAMPDNGSGDFERALTLHGQLQAQAIGDWLAEQQMIPQHIIASAAHRARETAELVWNQLSPPPSLSIQVNLYQANADNLLQFIFQQDDKRDSIMVIGHNPTLEELLYSQLDSPNNLTLGLQPGSLAIIEVNTSWSKLNPDACQLSQLIHADKRL